LSVKKGESGKHLYESIWDVRKNYALQGKLVLILQGRGERRGRWLEKWGNDQRENYKDRASEVKGTKGSGKIRKFIG